MADSVTGAAAPGYHERLWVPWYAWLLCPLAALAMSAVALVLMPAVGVWAVAAATAALVAVVLWRAGPVVAVVTQATVATTTPVAGQRVLVAGRARIEIEHLAAVAVLDAAEARQLRLSGYDPSAFHLMRSWIGQAITVAVIDPRDPTPYWYVSTRHPQALAAALGSAVGHQRPGEGPTGVSPG